jgi:hypothetical protein
VTGTRNYQEPAAFQTDRRVTAEWSLERFGQRR